MATILDNLVENLQRQISRGETSVRLDANVLNEFMADTSPSLKAAPEIKAVPDSVKDSTTSAIEVPPVEVSSEPTAPTFQPTPPTVEKNLSTQPLEKQEIADLSLAELRRQGNSCSACRFTLGEQRSQDIATNEKARLMIISEPAGRADEQMADPFHGEAGALLLKMIGAMKIDLNEIYMCMAHRCFGPGAREKIAETKPYLLKQIELVKPEVILLFGGAALNILLNEQSLMNNRGRWLVINGIPAIATFPPAYLLRKAESKKEAWQDMQQVMARLQT